MRNLWAAVIVVGIVFGVRGAFTRPFMRSVGRFAPEPFWIYLLSILCGISGIVPQDAGTFRFISSYILPAAIFLMLVGSPVTELARLGRKASIAMALAAGTMWVAMIGCHVLFSHWLPANSWKGAGALLGTWIGGSANMVAVKEILGMPDSDLAPLIIVDTLLSYAWLALLLIGPAFQKAFDGDAAADAPERAPVSVGASSPVFPVWLPILAAAGVALLCAWLGKGAAAMIPAVPSTGWTLLLATLFAILAALTPLRALESAGASGQGGIALYVVLAGIGARTELHAAAAAPVYILFGTVVLLVHGAMLLGLSRWLRIPLYLAATASQANVGGAVSAPIVSEAYQPGTASVAVLMAVAGTLMGTWAGVTGGLACRWIESLGGPMNLSGRWVHFAEIAAFYLLALATIWWGDKLRPSIVFVALLLVGICVSSNVFHGDSLHRVGLSARELWPCTKAVLVVCVPLLIPLSLFAWRNRFWAPWNGLFEVAGYPFWSFAQEYAMLGFVTSRLEDGLDGKTDLIPWINGLLFSMAHLPNPVLMTVTFISAVVFTKIFRAHRQLIPISLAHAVFGLGISLSLSFVNGVMSVGPGYYTRIGTPPSW